jgi:hypothetical protein
MIRFGALALLLASCTAPSVTGTVEGEPVCADFQLAGSDSKMKGSLRRPVKVTVLEDNDVRWERVLLGKRTAEDAGSRFVVEDDNETYTVRWAQCSNVFAPKRVDKEGRAADNTSNYSCGDASVYKEEKLEVRSGEANTRVIHWVAPPEAGCWEGTTEDKPKPEPKP